MAVVAACLAATAFTRTAVAADAQLYGWTRIAEQGSIDFVRINLATGTAAHAFTIQLPSGYDEARDLTYDPRNGRFYGNVLGPAGFGLAEVDPVSQSLTQFNAYSGLEGGGTQGLEYVKGVGLVVAGYNADASFNVLYVVDGSGVVQSRSIDLPEILDQDHLGANSSGGELYVLDWNDPTHGFEINRWVDPFGSSPTLSGVYDGSITGDAVDLAVEPMTNTFYSSNRIAGELLRYDLTAQIQEVVGSGYDYPRAIWGIAFAIDNPIPVKGTTWGHLKSLYR